MFFCLDILLKKTKLIKADNIGARLTIIKVLATFVFSIEITNKIFVTMKVQI